MLTPEYLQSVPDAMVELYARAEADILADMARRINGFDMFIPSAQYQMHMLEEMGALRSDIVRELSRLTGKSKKELTAIMREAGMETLAADEAIYKAAGLSSSPAAASSAVQEVLAAGLKKTNGLFTNLTKTTANTATKQFERALDRAYMQISSGAIDPATATKNAIKSLAKDGVGAITYPSGHVDSLEVAVRRATITGVNQTCLKVQEARADELGVDLVETTAHAGARPSHAEWQGQIFSRSGKSSKYPDFVQSTGYGTGAGLGGWNCNHSFRPYLEGMPRTYSKELLDSYEAKDYEYNGRKMTEYEALQQQRSIERSLRRWKRENVAMKAAGLDTTESAAKIAKWQGVQKDFISQTGLKRQAERESIAGWGRSQAASARADAKKYEKALAEKQRYDTMVAELKKAGGLPKAAKVNIPPKAVSVADLSFDDVHINKERGHNATRAQAEAWIRSARVSVTVWNGQYERYFSNAGAAYVDTKQKAIRTAFPAEQYDDRVKAMLEVLDEYEKAR